MSNLLLKSTMVIFFIFNSLVNSANSKKLATYTVHRVVRKNLNYGLRVCRIFSCALFLNGPYFLILFLIYFQGRAIFWGNYILFLEALTTKRLEKCCIKKLIEHHYTVLLYSEIPNFSYSFTTIILLAEPVLFLPMM